QSQQHCRASPTSSLTAGPTARATAPTTPKPSAPSNTSPGRPATPRASDAPLTKPNGATGPASRFRHPNGGRLTPNGQVIVARLHEGYTGEQLREVVLLKSEQWRSDAKMVQYLRPQTLFGAQKFAQYVGELGVPA